MTGIEKILYSAAFFLFAVLSLFIFWGVGPPKVRSRVSFFLVFLLGAHIAARWIYSGHPPVFGTFEKTLSASFTVMLFSLALDRKERYRRFTVPFAFATLLYGAIFDSTHKPLVISEQSLWIYFHVLTAWLSYGFYTLSFAASLWVVFGRDKDEGAGTLKSWLLWGFFFQTLFFSIGSYYSSRLHGAWWMWDPVEYLFIASWFVSAITLHGQVFFNWEKRRLARWIGIGFATTFLLYWGLTYIPWATYHIFDVEIKTHVRWER
jgi:ABC-type transport system involved in cytochrome c biogenesis permease subunit